MPSLDAWRASAEAPPPSAAFGDPAGIEGAKPAPLPRRIVPQLATLTKAPPAGDGYWHEIKLDGYRLLCVRAGDGVRLLTRRGLDWTERFAGIARALAALDHDLVLDGEAVVLDRHGKSDFGALQRALSGGPSQIHYYAFDLLHLDGYDLRPAPLRARKEALRVVLAGGADQGVIRYSDHVVGGGEAFLREACRMGLEGIVSKRADAPYRSGRNKHFLKIKCRLREELVVVGFTAPQGARTGIGALVVATRDGGGALRYAGKVGTGFRQADLTALHAALAPLARPEPPVDATLPPRERRRTTWVDPRMVVEVELHGWTDDGLVRHGSFVGRREDKPAAEVRRERPQALPIEIDAQRGEARVMGVRLSSPDKVLYPEQGLRKIDLAAYYAQVGEAMLPWVYDRPLTLLRCPEGRHAECFYQKQAHRSVPASLPRVRVKRDTDYLTVRRVEDLLALVQLGVLEIHVWGARADRLDRPDILVLDLDPGPGVAWRDVVATAGALRERVAALGLTAFVRVTGGKGLHLVIPIERRTDWDDAKAFTRGLAGELTRAAPSRYTANMSKAKRKGKIFVDYLRNDAEATAIASYSLRAREGAPVACPVGWDEIADTDEAPRFGTEAVIARVNDGIDPWRDMPDARARLTQQALGDVTRRR